VAAQVPAEMTAVVREAKLLGRAAGTSLLGLYGIRGAGGGRRVVQESRSR